MNKIVLYSNDCIKEIKEYISKNNYEIIEEKTKFEDKYISTYDQKEYPIKVDWYVSFKSKKGFIHKMYFYFLEFHSNDIFKISDIKSKNNHYAQMTTKVADFSHYGETGNQGFINYRYKVSHNYHNFFKALDKNKNSNEIPYVCVLLKYKNHAGEWPRGRYYANSFSIFMKSGITNINNFEIMDHNG
ncbi:MAG: hypothetical protein OHM57_02565 [Spiroplasma phoeniceum]|nr:MAG: hypothetical protein OHM57_02565 [Spiroplasma phoeniceum]